MNPVPPRSRAHAILTDLHFWIPAVVLAIGLAILIVVARP
jgi:hypothetical protein